ncbi:MAG: hypothetical protein AAF483_25090 [Planctomycetota bacterium]
MSHSYFRARFCLTILPILLVLVFESACPAQRGDPFEGGEPRWRLVESDCAAQLTQQEISLIFPRSGRTSELVEVACTHGTSAILAYPIEPSTIIDEFRPRLCTRCSSSQIRMGVRVVFPFATHPATGSRLTTILWGDVYSTPGQWQTLNLPSLVQRFRDESVAIRQRFGSEIKLDGAFIDCIVLNAYTGPGRYRLQIDDLELPGMITLAQLGNSQPPNWRQLWRWRFAAPSAESQFWAQPNLAPVWIQHRGEQLSWLESLGFTGLVTSQVPTPEQLQTAQQLELGIISPPPTFGVEFPEESLPTLKGWLIGTALDKQQKGFVDEQARRVAALPKQLQRPLVAETLEDFFQFSRSTDEVIIPQPIAASAGSEQEKIHWLNGQLQATKQRSEGWVSVNLGVPPSISSQLIAAKQSVAPDTDDNELAVNPVGFRHQVTSAVIAGARGFLIRTFRPLDIKDAADSAQIAGLRLVQQDLQLWGPWIVGGQRVQSPAIDSSDWASAAWAIEDNILVVAKATSLGAQSCSPPTMGRPLHFGLAMPNTRQTVFRLTGGRMERIATEPGAAGARWAIEQPAAVETFLITSSPTVINFTRNQLAESANTVAADQIELVSRDIAHAARILESRFSGNAAASPLSLSHTRALSSAQRMVDSSLRALRNQQTLAAIQLNLQARDAVQSVLFESYKNASSALASPQSSPLIATPAALVLHWKIADACGRSQWQTLSMPGSEFTNLATMLNAGWSQQRRLEEQADLRVELVPGVAPAKGGLRMASYSKTENNPLQSGFAGASLRIRSASVPVKAGQLVRVSGNAAVVTNASAPDAGLLIYDNQAGPSLGQLVHGEKGKKIPIELYRFALADGEFRILAECRGECDMVMEDLRVDVIQPATNRYNFVTNPLDRIRLKGNSLSPPSGTLSPPIVSELPTPSSSASQPQSPN